MCDGMPLFDTKDKKQVSGVNLFTPEDFGLPKEPYGIHVVDSVSAANIANAKLESWLKEAPTIWLDDEELNFSEEEYGCATRKAKLVCVESLRSSEGDK